MSAPQSNPPNRDQPSGHVPSVISVPTTPMGAMQTMLNMLSTHQAGSQGAPAPVATRDIHIPTSAQEIANMAEALVHASASAAPASPHALTHSPPPGSPPPPAPAPTTQFVADVTIPPVAASSSSHGGRPHTPPRGTARVTRSSSALPELGYIQPRPIPVPGGDAYRRSTAHYAESETFAPINARDDQEKKSKVRVHSFPIAFSVFSLTVLSRISSPQVLWASDWNRRSRKPRQNASKRSGRVRTRQLLLSNVISNTIICCANLIALITTWALHIATGLQVLIGALTTALGAALSGKNVRVSLFSICRNQS